MKQYKQLFLLMFLVSQIYSYQEKYIIGNGFKDFANYYVENFKYNFDPKKLKQKSIIFVDRTSAEFFFDKLFPQITVPFILITHNADLSSPREFIKYIDDKRILRWYGENCDIKYHPKFFPLPIGVQNPKCSGDMRVFDVVLDSIEKSCYDKKIHKLYLNFATNTDVFRSVHNTVPQSFNSVPFREKLYQSFKNKPFVFVASRKPFKEYLLEMSQYLFILSPFGGGLDCFRTWEALLVGSIPVVYSSTLNSLYEGLPVIIVDNWEQVNEEFLEKKYQEIKDKQYNKEKLFIQYWLDLIKGYKLSLPFFAMGPEYQFLTNEQFLIWHVKNCITKAEAKKSKLTKKILSISGMSSPKVRHLLNNLCSIAGVGYLEIGVLKGSTFVSALYGNHDYLVDAIAIDNWSEFNVKKNEFIKNADTFLPKNEYRTIAQDAFTVDLNEFFNKPINVFFYDGKQSKEAQKQAFMYYDKVFADTFIAVVDDWNWLEVQQGTKEAFTALNYKILYEEVLPANFNGDLENWWNGVYIAVIKKSK